jgi:DNA modification methylase
LALLRQLVELFTDPDDVVIDPCAGSGSSLIAAAGLNRKAYGFEIKKNIYSDACDLIKHNIQFDLFAESQQMERRRQAMYDTRTLFDVNETKEDEK